MTIRTFIQRGQAYGIEPVTITAQIDGVQVFSGPVNTIDEPVPALPSLDTQIGVDIFSWAEDVLFSGTKTMEITVTGGTLLVTSSSANYCPVTGDLSPLTFSTGPDIFAPYYTIEQADGSLFTDPITNVFINGVSVERDTESGLTGNWIWKVPHGTAFVCTINVQSGVEVAE